MDDNNVRAENQDATPEGVVATPTTEEEAVKEQEQAESEGQEGKPERKTTRAERRIREFSEKTRKLAEENARLKEELMAGRISESDIPSLFQEGETEIDPIELQQRIDRLVEAKVEAKLAEREAISREIENYQRVYEEHQKDLESISDRYPELDSSKGGDPELERRFVELFERLNSRVIDGRRVYYPNVPASEVAEMILGIKESVVRSEVSSFTGKTVRQEMERALSPTGAKGPDREYELEDLKRRASDSGDESLWAEYLKRSGIVKL